MKTYDDVTNLLSLIGFKKYPKKMDAEYWEYDKYKCKIITDNTYKDLIFDVYKLNKENMLQEIVYSNDFENVYEVLSEEFKFVLRKIKINKLLSDR